MYKIRWSQKALRGLRKIDRSKQEGISDAVDTLADFENAKNVKALTMHPYGYRMRVGDYRILFDVETQIRIVEVQEVKKRDDNTY